MKRLLKISPVFLLLSGCYIAKQALGQIDILIHREPLEKAAAKLPPDERDKLRLVAEIKKFSEERVGLKPTGNYSTYYDTKGKPITYVVSACAKNRFEPYTWWFPIVGTVPYKGFFSKADAMAEARELQAAGWDVDVGAAGAYSTLGWFSDPVLSTMLDDNEEDLAGLILHELTHSTLYVAGHVDFNESFAQFVGQQAALEFVRWRFGERSEIYDRAILRFADEELFDKFMQEFFTEVREYYRSRPADVLAGREKIFARWREKFVDLQPSLHDDRFDWFLRIPLNNATILGHRRYGRAAAFRGLFDACGGDWKKFFARIAAIGKSENPMKSLESSIRGEVVGSSPRGYNPAHGH